jgi:hypothetical protein
VIPVPKGFPWAKAIMPDPGRNPFTVYGICILEYPGTWTNGSDENMYFVDHCAHMRCDPTRFA